MTCLAIGVAIGSQGLGDVATYTVTITGLTSGEARPGDHASIGFTTDPVGGTITQRWGSTLGGSEYGTGSAPTDYTAGDGGTLYLEVTRDGEVVRASAPILYAAPAFSVQPTITGTLAVGETLTLTEGTASPAATLSITTFTLDGVDKSGELVGLDWDTTGESVYGTAGAIAYQVSATNSGGTTLSNLITATLQDVPDAFVIGDWSVAAGADNEADVTISSLPDDGNDTITDVEYSVDGGTWTSSAGTVSFTITGLTPGSREIRLRAHNGVTPGNGDASDTKSVTVTGTAAVNPTFTLGTQTAGSGGSADSIAVSAYSYGGADDLDLYIATGASSFAITEAQLIAGSGGSGVEFANVTGYTGGAVSLTGLTDDTVVEVAAVLVERANGGSSGITRATLTDIDFTPLGFTSAEATDANTVVVTLNDTVLPTTGNTGTWAFNIAGSPATVTGAAVSGSTVTLTVSDTMTSGQTLNALAYTPGNLTDERGNALASFSGQSITNSVPAGGTAPTVTFLDNGTLGVIGTSAPGTLTLDSSTFPSGADLVVCLFGVLDGAGGKYFNSLTVDAVGATELTAARTVTVGTNECATQIFTVSAPTLGSTVDIDVLGNGGTEVVYRVGVAIYAVENATSYVGYQASATGSGAVSVAPTVATDDAAIAIAGAKDSTAWAWTSPMVEDAEQDSGGNEVYASASLDGLTSGTLTIEATRTAGTGQKALSAVIIT